MRRFLQSLSMLLLLSVLCSGLASAHVTVSPKETTQGAYEKFTVRVPSEKEAATIKIELKIPTEAVAISRFEPTPGWSYQVSRDSENNIIGVIWTATSDGLAGTEFQEFNMLGKVQNNAKTITWKAYQHYKDGSIVEWVGVEGSDKPASVTKVNSSSSGSVSDGHGNSLESTTHNNDKTDLTNLTFYLSIAALFISVLALFSSFKRRRS